eukprot:gene18936-24743_t
MELELSESFKLQGDCKSLSDYAIELNPYVQVNSLSISDLSSYLNSLNETSVLIAAEVSLSNSSSVIVTVVDVLGPHAVVVISDTTVSIANSTTSVKKLKQSQKIRHRSLNHLINRPLFNSCNSCLSNKADKALNLLLFACFKAFEDIQSLVSLTTFSNTVIAKLVGLGIRFPERSVKNGGIGEELLNKVIKKFYISSNKLGRCPITESIVGALVAQESIKAISHISNDLSDDLSDDSDDMTLVYGRELADEIRSLNIFIVGSGAIGCELLKSFALTNIGTKNSTVYLTDMDHIERSNLNRQLLFRERHIGRSKAEVANEMIRTINPTINIKSFNSKVDISTEELFNHKFYEQIDIITTALDNVDARRYIDSQCVRYGKWLIDSGTLGVRANTQVVIPHITESYSSSSDPPEEGIPLCTLKSFPYHADHCIAWARSIFNEIFNQDISNLNTAMTLTNNSLITWLDTLPEEDVNRLLTLSRLFPLTTTGIVNWSIDLFNKLFNNDINRLLVDHPIDEIDEDTNTLFWSGSRRLPVPITRFNTSDPEHAAFIKYSSKILSECLGYQIVADDFNEAIQSFSYLDSSINASNNIEQLESRLESLRESNVLYKVVEFDKDDLSLGHIGLVRALAQLRCQVYSIPTYLTDLQVQKIAGNIIPALATTTAIVAGLVSLEIIKIAGEIVRQRKQLINQSIDNKPTGSLFNKIWNRVKKSTIQSIESTIVSKNKLELVIESSKTNPNRLLDRFRNSFINTAKPTLAFAVPVDAPVTSISSKYFNLWSKIEISTSFQSLTLIELMNYLRDQFDVTLETLSIGEVVIYADFISQDVNIDDTIYQIASSNDLIEDISIWSHRGFIELEATAKDSKDSEIQLPAIKLRYDRNIDEN